jgi:integrase
VAASAELPDLRAVTFTDHLKPMVLLALNTGMRRGEIFNLQWSHLDLPRTMLKVEGSGTKSVRTRYIPLNDDALTVLSAWRDQTEGENFIFPARDAGRMDNITRAWRNLTKKAKVADFNFHDIRHDFASRLVMAGVDLNTVRELLGHTDIKMTLRYAHLAPEHKRLAVSKLLRKVDSAKTVIS